MKISELPLSEDTKNALKKIDAALQDISAVAQPMLQVIQGVAEYAKQAAPVILEIYQAIQDGIPQEKLRIALITLAKHGWYLDPKFTVNIPFDLAKEFKDNNISQANEALCNYVDSQLEETEQSLCTKFPKRAHLLQSAFAAHRRGEYALSIPVFLAQTDGLCSEIIGCQLYKKRSDGIPAIASKLTSNETFEDALLAPIIERDMPISVNTKHSSYSVDGLNRHAVLHGESVDYDKRVNGCRAISLVTYVAWVVCEKAKKLAKSHESIK